MKKNKNIEIFKCETNSKSILNMGDGLCMDIRVNNAFYDLLTKEETDLFNEYIDKACRIVNESTIRHLSGGDVSVC